MTFEIFFAFWQKVGPDLEFPGTQAGDDASYVEWTDEYNGCKFQGMRKPDGGQKHGIVRTISNDGDFIEEATYYQDKLHGLCFAWLDRPTVAFEAEIYDHGQVKAGIWW